ncbi:MAG: hypothetical protein QXY70_00745 [Nanopusillaceae archaeon]
MKFKRFIINIHRLLNILKKKGFKTISAKKLYELAKYNRKKDYPIPHKNYFIRFIKKYLKKYKIIKTRKNYYIILHN